MGIVAVNLVNAWIRKQGKLSAINKARNAVKTDMPSRAGSSAKHTRTRIIVASDTVREREEVPCKRIGETMPIGNLHGRFELSTAMPRLAPAKPHKGRTYGNGSIPPSPPIPPVSKSDIAVKAYGKGLSTERQGEGVQPLGLQPVQWLSTQLQILLQQPRGHVRYGGGSVVSLKKSLVDTGTAFGIFKAELTRWRTYIIRDGGLHFNFVSDPCLLETIELNFRCVEEAQSQGVLCKVLTKRSDWLDHLAVQKASPTRILSP